MAIDTYIDQGEKAIILQEERGRKSCNRGYIARMP